MPTAGTTWPPVSKAASDQLVNKADKTTTYTKTEDDANVAVVKALGLVTPSSIEAFGDSRPAGFLASSAAMAFPNRLADVLGIPVTNFAATGATVSGTATQGGLPRLLRTAAVLPTATSGPYINRGGMKLLQISANDGELMGRTAATAAYLEGGGLLAFMSFVRASRIAKAEDAAWSGSAGGVAGDGTLVAGSSYFYFNANGQTKTFTTDATYDGGSLTFLIPHFAAYTTTGSLNFRRDPAGANQDLGTYNGSAVDAGLKAASGGARDGVSCFRIDAGVLPAGVNVIRATASGLTGGNYCALSDVLFGSGAPLLLPLYESRDTADDSKMVWSNARISAVAPRLNNVLTVNLDAALNNAKYFGDQYHENDLGTLRVVSALLAELPKLLTTDNVAEGRGGFSTIRDLFARQSVTKTTASLAANATENGTVTLGKSFRAIRVITTRPARVRLYSTAAQRTADANRAFGTAPTGNHGVILDIQTAADTLTLVLSPQAPGSNLETTPTEDIPYAITNVDSASGTVGVTLSHFKTEA